MMANNTLEEPSVPIGEYLKDPVRMDGFAKLTETYLQRSGLRVVTIWDDLTSKQRKSYEANCRHLYGATVQNFKDVPSVAGSIENKRVLFDKLVIPYAGSYEHMSDSLTEQIKGWSGHKPLFVSYQANIWGDLKPEKLIQLHQDIQKKFPGKVEFVRADHYFNLHNQANSLPFNLTMLPNLAVDSSDSEENVDLLTDGTPAKIWTASSSGDQWFGLDFGKNYQISRYVIRHAGDGAMGSEFNNADFKVGTSEDGKSWKLIHTIVGNKLNVTDMEFEPVMGRYVKFLFKGSKSDGKVRVADLEVYGTSVERK
jgi:F5/8 type C domain/GxGYxYP putative glycoside hydrolase C-terminal domain